MLCAQGHWNRSISDNVLYWRVGESRAKKCFLSDSPRSEVIPLWAKSLYSAGQPGQNPAFGVLFIVKQVLGLIQLKWFFSNGDSFAPLSSGTFGSVWRYFCCHSLGEELCWCHLVSRGQGYCWTSHPAHHSPLTTKNCLAQSSPRWENLEF